MNTTRTLMVALVVQLALAAVTWWAPSPEALTNQDLFADLDVAEVTRISVEGGGESVALERGGDGWVFPTYRGHPARASDADALLDALDALEVDADPVTRQRVSHASLSVSEQEFTRKIALVEGGDERVVYVGRGNGGALYARRAGEDEVFRLRRGDLGALNARPSSYVDTSWVDLDEDELREVEVEAAGGSVALARQEGGEWAVTNDPSGAAHDQGAVDRLASRLLSVRMARPSELAPAEVTPEGGARVRWLLADGTSGSYVVGAARGDVHPAHRDGGEHVVALAKSVASPILEASLEGLRAEEGDAASP
jgi:hypothetical protein